jgi:hypothetical protein
MSHPAAALRILCDFNAGGKEDGYWLLFYNGRPLEEQFGTLGLSQGSLVVLYPDEEDFEVPAILRRGRSFGGLGDEAWLAFPDWSKLIYHD